MHTNFISDLAAFFVQIAKNAAQEAQQELKEIVSECQTAYQLGAVALALTGANKDTAYQSCPKMNARTVRRVLADVPDTVRMCMYSDSLQQTNTLGHLESGVLADIQQLAEQAKVRPQIATAAVTRYLNSPERVSTVLKDLKALQDEHIRVWNPTGLFTRLMRNGEQVRLPERVQQARQEAYSAKETEAARPVPVIGALTRAFGEICRVVEIVGNRLVVEDSSGSLCNLNRDLFRPVPVPASST